MLPTRLLVLTPVLAVTVASLAGLTVTADEVAVHVIVGTVTTALELEALSSALIVKLLAPLTRFTETDQLVE